LFYFYHFFEIQRLSSVRGEDISYIFGLPLVQGMPYFPQNFSRQDMGVAEGVLNFITNFCKTGDPNEAGHKVYNCFVFYFCTKLNLQFLLIIHFERKRYIQIMDLQKKKQDIRKLYGKHMK
jgi:hypothetical protein